MSAAGPVVLSMLYLLQELFVRLKREPRTRRFFSVRLPPRHPRPFPKIIWCLWLQGQDQAPEIVQYCIASWRRHNPDYAFRLLDKSTLADFIDTAHIPEELEVSAYANLVRTRLLADHGGVWVDATLLCTRPLDHWLPPLMQAGFFCFDRPDSFRSMDNWFLATEKDGALARRLDRIITGYWTSRVRTGRRTRPTYFWYHFLVEFHTRFDRGFRKLWQAIPKVSADGPHCLQFHMTGFDTSGDLGCLPAVPVHKLTYKAHLTPETVEEMLARYS